MFREAKLLCSPTHAYIVSSKFHSDWIVLHDLHKSWVTTVKIDHAMVLHFDTVLCSGPLVLSYAESFLHYLYKVRLDSGI